MQDRPQGTKGTIFLSGSIPDPARWTGEFHPLEITDAVVAFARACLTRGFRIVTAAHPTLAPLLLYVAAEFPNSNEPQILVYQSLLFEDVLPVATRRFEADGVGELIWTEAVEGDSPTPNHWHRSLAMMRERMLGESDPWGAAFVGGMDGIEDEYARFVSRYPGRPVCALRRPGGVAASLHLDDGDKGPASDDDSDSYPTVWSRFLDRIEPPSRPNFE